MRRSLLMLAALVAAWCAPGASSAIQIPPTRQVRLPNGAVLILAEKHDVPLIAFNAVLRGGTLGDAPGKEGTASLACGLLRKGAGKRTAQEIAAFVDGLGADLDAGVTLEFSYVSSEFLSRDQTAMLDLIGDVMRRPTFPQDEFEKLKSQTIDAIASAKDDPDNVVGEYAFAFLYGDHPYARPVDGDEATNRDIVREDVTRYYRDNFGGDRLIITVVGDFGVAAMESRIKALFGDWPKASAPPPQAPSVTRRTGRRVLLVDKPDATQSYFWIGNVGAADLDPDRVALDIANTAYGGRFTSILNTALRIQGGLTYGARWQAPRFTQPGTAAIYSYTKTESTEKAIEMALRTLAQVRRDGIDSTITSAKTYTVGQYPPRYETEGQIAGALARLAFYGLDRKEIETYIPRVEAVRAEDARRVIQRVYPPPEDLTFVLVGNASAIRAVAAKYGPVTEVKITEPLLSGMKQAARH